MRLNRVSRVFAGEFGHFRLLTMLFGAQAHAVFDEG